MENTTTVTVETKRKMSVHAALAELKKYDSKINKAIKDCSFIGMIKGSSDKVQGTTSTREEYEALIKAKNQSVNDLMKEANAVKRAIVLSNATTIIPEFNMTVAEVIEYKQFITYKKSLLEKMKSAYSSTMNNIEYKNTAMEADLDNQLAGLGDKVKLGDYADTYRQQNGWEAVDPLNLKAEIDKLSDEIINFESNVDVALSMSNATTFIEI